MLNLLIKIFYSLLIASLAKPFIATTGYSSFYPLFVSLFVTTFMCCSKLEKKYKIMAIIIGSLILLFVYTNVDTLSFGLWFKYILGDLKIKLGAFISRDLSLIPQEIGLVSTYIIVSVSALIMYKKGSFWKTIVVSYTCFYLVLSAFLKIQFREATLSVIVLGLLIGVLETYKSNETKNKSQVLTSLCVLLLISTLGFNYNRYYSVIQHKIIESSIQLRSKLSADNFYEIFNLKNKNSSPSKSGYSEDSSHLGGPLYMDYSLLFSVKEEVPTYWRVDAKYHYNGLGWSNSKNQINVNSITLPENFGKETLNPDAPIQHQIIESAKEIEFLPIPLGQSQIISSIDLKHIQSSNRLLGSHELDTITFDPLETDSLTSLTFETRPPLRTKEILNEIVSSNKSQDLINELSLRSIPISVKNLAIEVTKSGETMYEKALLLENYLKQSEELKYSLSDVPYVPRGMNYVEHFLFTSKIGYCEHFASSFVVMAQSIGIPTRYAKGFSKGTHSKGVTMIRNSDAHAWPEVYFEDYGWIPFEPTPSFNLNQQTSQPNEIEMPTTLPNTDGINAEKPTTDNDSTVVNPSTNTEIDVIKKENSLNYSWIIPISILIALGVIIMKNRKEIYRHALVRKLNKTHYNFTDAFDLVLKGINVYYPRQQSTLISEHILTLPIHLQENLIDLLIRYEKIVYGQDVNYRISLEDRRIFTHILELTTKKTDV